MGKSSIDRPRVLHPMNMKHSPRVGRAGKERKKKLNVLLNADLLDRQPSREALSGAHRTIGGNCTAFRAERLGPAPRGKSQSWGTAAMIQVFPTSSPPWTRFSRGRGEGRVAGGVACVRVVVRGRGAGSSGFCAQAGGATSTQRSTYVHTCT